MIKRSVKFILLWTSVSWWKYLLHEDDKPRSVSILTKIKCRMSRHSCGPVYYDLHPSSTEPDWTCKKCGDYLG